MMPKVLKLYNAISKKDRKELDDFVFTGFSGLSKESQEFYKYIAKDEHLNFEKEMAWKFIFGSKTYNDSKMRKIIFEFTKGLERFIAFLQLEQDDLLYQNLISQYLYKNDVQELLLKQHRNFQRIIDSPEKVSESHLFYDFLNEEFLYNISPQKSLLKSDNVGIMFAKLEKFYVVAYLRVLLKQVSLHSLKAGSVSDDILEQLLTVAGRRAGDDPLTRALVLCIRTYIERENVELYFELKQFIKDYESVLDYSILEDAFRSGANFGIHQTNKGNALFYTEVVELYKMGIENGVLLSQGVLNLNIFKNAVTLLLKARKFDDAMAFIEKYSALLKATVRDNEKTYSMGQILFYKKEFGMVLKKLSEVEIKNVNYDLNSKALIAATYYELNEKLVLSSFLDSFRVMLSRKKDKIRSDRRSRYKNFVQFLDQILKFGGVDRNKLESIETKIINTQNVTNKRWLLEKISELK